MYSKIISSYFIMINYNIIIKKWYSFIEFINCAKDLRGDHNFDLVTLLRFPGRGQKLQFHSLFI